MSKKSKKFMKVKRIAVIVAFFILSISGTLFISRNRTVLADTPGFAAVSTQGGFQGGISIGCGDKITCYGANYGGMWMKFSLTNHPWGDDWRLEDPGGDQPDVVVVDNHTKAGTVDVWGGTLTGCRKNGATEFYRLAWMNVSLRNDSYGNRVNWAYLTPPPYNSLDQIGLLQVRNFNVTGDPSARGNTILLTGDQAHGQDEDWQTVYNNYVDASEYLNIKTPWADVSMFCYNPEWKGKTKKSNFESWSKVEYDGGSADTWSAADSGKTVEISSAEDVVQVTFSHQISYIGAQPVDGASFGAATTSWNVSETEMVAGVELPLDNGKRGDTLVVPKGDEGFNKEDAKAAVYQPHNAFITMKDLAAGQRRTICSTITYAYKNIGWLEKTIDMYTVDSQTGQAHSKICIIVKKIAPPQPVDAEVEFKSQSSVGGSKSGIDKVLANDDIKPEDFTSGKTPSGIGEAAYTAMVVDGDGSQNVNINFGHTIFYELKNPQQFANKDEVEAVSTTYKIQHKIKKATIGGAGSSGWETSELPEKTYEPKWPKQNGQENIRDPVSVTIEQGQIALVCSIIKYQPKYGAYKIVDDSDRPNPILDPNDPEYNKYFHDPRNYLNNSYNLHNFFKYAPDISKYRDVGASEACAFVGGLGQPEGTPWSSNKSDGSGNGAPQTDPMYAGESTYVGWNVEAIGNKAKRLKRFQAVNFVIDAKEGVSDLHGNKKYMGNDVCSYFKENFKIISCDNSVEDIAIADPYDNSNGSSGPTIYNTQNSSRNIIAPNEVGRKHAVSVGYFIEVYAWRCISYCDPPDPDDDDPPDPVFKWIHLGYENDYHGDTGPVQDYWHIFSAASRPVLKKPTFSVWNGGIFSEGNILSTIAERYQKDAGIVYEKTEDNSIDKTFGSWSEYLATIGRTTNAFTSGSAMFNGLESYNLLDNSPLTISNTGAIGNSQITPDSILQRRLYDYFCGNGSSKRLGLEVWCVDSIEIKNDDGSKTWPIGSGGGTYPSVYAIPQTIVYATGRITINKDIEQINAWLITEDEIDTCSDFHDKTTEAKVAGGGDKDCSKNLQINGPVIAKSIKLNRTYGADSTNGDKNTAVTGGDSDPRAATAEVFNLDSGLTYLWGYAQATRFNSGFSEAYSRELPPRY